MIEGEYRNKEVGRGSQTQFKTKVGKLLSWIFGDDSEMEKASWRFFIGYTLEYMALWIHGPSLSLGLHLSLFSSLEYPETRNGSSVATMEMFALQARLQQELSRHTTFGKDLGLTQGD